MQAATIAGINISVGEEEEEEDDCVPTTETEVYGVESPQVRFLFGRFTTGGRPTLQFIIGRSLSSS